MYIYIYIKLSTQKKDPVSVLNCDITDLKFHGMLRNKKTFSTSRSE